MGDINVKINAKDNTQSAIKSIKNSVKSLEKTVNETSENINKRNKSTVNKSLQDLYTGMADPKTGKRAMNKIEKDTQAMFSGIKDTVSKPIPTKGLSQLEMSMESGAKTANVVTSEYMDMSESMRRGIMEKTAGLGTILNMNFKQWQNNTQAGYKYQKMSARAGQNVRMMTHGLRGFRMEALGVMFYGMAMKAMFLGWLQPAMESAGIFDILKMTLLDLFLPVIIDHVLPVMLKVMDWFMNLSPEIKKVIGFITIFGVIFGTVLMLIGTVVLGVGSVILLFGTALGLKLVGAVLIVSVAIAGIVTAILWLAEPLLYVMGIFSKLTKAVLGFVGKAMTYLFGFRDDGTNVFNDFAKNGIKKIKELVKLGVDKIKDFVKDFYEAHKPIIDKFLGPFKTMRDKIAPILSKIKSKVLEKIQPIIDLFKKLKAGIRDLLGLPAEVDVTVNTRQGSAGNRSTMTPYERLALGPVSTDVTPLDDFIISGNKVFKTNPADTIFGTKTPNELSGNNNSEINLTVSPVINITGNTERIDEHMLAERIGVIVMQNLRNITLV